MAGTRQVYRGSRGRFAGARNGKAERVRTSTRLSTRAKSLAHNRKVQVGAGALVAGGVGYAAFNHVNPGTTLRKSGLQMPGAVSTFGGKSASKPEYTVVKNATHQFTTTSIGKGLKQTHHTVIESVGKKGTVNAIGYVDSKQTVLGTRVTHSYLTRANRGKGLGKQALATHAAHRPRATYRASMDRSNMGQAFAKSVGGAGARSKKSSAAGASITKTLDYDWRVATKNDRSNLAKGVKLKTKGMSPHKVTGKKIKR